MKSEVIPLLLGLGLFLGLTSCTQNAEEAAKSKGQEIWFEEYVHDYGTIQEDSDGTHAFEFKNLGKQSIVINRVRSTCGCTIPDWPRTPFEPGDTGKIVVRYNTATTGSFMKSVFVYSSASNSPVKLQIKGKVIPKDV